MRNWTLKHSIVFFLGLWVALAPIVFAMQAAAMTQQTSMSDDIGSGRCDDCPGSDADRSVCEHMCLNAAHFITLTDAAELLTEFGDGHEPGRHLAMLGRLSTPDPAPPKSVSLS